MLNKARTIYGELITEYKIVYVDSLYKVIYDNLEAGLGFDEIRKSGPEKSNLISEMVIKATELGEDLKDLTYTYSNFEQLINTLDHFVLNEPFKNLNRIAERVRLAFNEVNGLYREKLRLKKAEYKDPHTFESVIRKAREDLKAWKKKLIHIPEKIEEQYGTSYLEEILEGLKNKYTEQFSICENFKELDTKVYNAVESIQEARSSYESTIEAEIENLVDKEQIEFTSETGGYNPKPNIERWKNESREKALRDEYVTVTESLAENWNWARFKWTKKSRTKQKRTGKQIIDQEAYLSASRDKASNWFISERGKLNRNLSKLKKSKLDCFKKEINKTIKERDEHLKDLLKKKSNNKKVKEQIQVIVVKIENMESHLETAKKIEEATRGTD